jgi:hypothetical protein
VALITPVEGAGPAQEALSWGLPPFGARRPTLLTAKTVRNSPNLAPYGT